MPDDEKVPFQCIGDLWLRGRYWEIFGLSDGNFTALELATRYSDLVNTRDLSPEGRRIVEDAFAVLNAPFTRQFYAGCRLVMESIMREAAEPKSTQAEARVWEVLWGWVSRRWQPPPDELMNSLKTDFIHSVSDGPAARATPEAAPKPIEAIPKQEEYHPALHAASFAEQVRCQRCGRFNHSFGNCNLPLRCQCPGEVTQTV